MRDLRTVHISDHLHKLQTVVGLWPPPYFILICKIRESFYRGGNHKRDRLIQGMIIEYNEY